MQYAPNPPSAATTLKEFVRRLRNADPENFEQFISAFAAYADEITVAVLDAPQEQILHMQGRAKQTHVILRLLKSFTHPTKAPE